MYTVAMVSAFSSHRFSVLIPLHSTGPQDFVICSPSAAPAHPNGDKVILRKSYLCRIVFNLVTARETRFDGSTRFLAAL